MRPRLDAPSMLVDAAKAVTAQLIVWHHLSLYGPMARTLEPVWPALFEWLTGPLRYGVQVFLVAGGWLAARALWPRPGSPRPDPRPLWWAWGAKVLQRYTRLAPPVWVAVVVAVTGAAAARWVMDDPDTPEAPTGWQLLTHLLLCHDLAGQEALTTGLWYVAIDLQLYALIAACALALGRCPARGRAGLGGLGLVLTAGWALGWANRQPDGALWAPYFWGSYALGVLAAWAGTLRGGARALVWALLLALPLWGLWVEWRDRLAVAAGVAWWLAGGWGGLALARRGVATLLALLARLSYGTFLLHYPLSLWVATLWQWIGLDSPAAALAGLLLTWGLSVAGAAALEQALAMWRARRSAPALWRRA